MKTKYIIWIGITFALLSAATTVAVKVITSYPVDVIKMIVRSLIKFGITNQFAQAGILAVVSTEHGFSPKSEMSYSKTKAPRIRQIFPSIFTATKYTDAQIDALKKDDVKFFDVVYGGKQGNGTNNGDGFKFRGRGFNGITFKDTYVKFARITGHDIVNNPDLLNTPQVAADVLAAFFADVLLPRIDTNSFKDLTTATFNAFRANAGWGPSAVGHKITTNTVLVAEHKKQLKNAPELLKIVQAA